MFTFLLVLLIIDSLILAVDILMQAGQGGGMAAAFGGVSSSASTIFGTRQAGNLLTKASWWCGGLFLVLSFALSMASTRARTPQSVLDNAFPAAPGQSTTQPAAPAAPATGLPLQDAGQPRPDSSKRP